MDESYDVVFQPVGEDVIDSLPVKKGNYTYYNTKKIHNRASITVVGLTTFCNKLTKIEEDYR